MAISRFYKKTVSTQRLSTVSGSKRESFQANLVTLSCAIHPLSPEKALVGGEAFYNVFKLFCGVSEDILVGDRIIDGTDTYTKEKWIKHFMEQAMGKAIEMTEGNIKRRTPVKTSNLRTSIGGAGGYKYIKPLKAEVGTNVKYAAAVNYIKRIKSI